MAEWLRRGLQILARRFDSGSGLQPPQKWLKTPKFKMAVIHFSRLSIFRVLRTFQPGLVRVRTVSCPLPDTRAGGAQARRSRDPLKFAALIAHRAARGVPIGN